MGSFAGRVLSVPTRNSTLRMRLWRALRDTGCAVLRDGVYLLPANGAAPLEKIESDIRAHGGFAMTLTLSPRSDVQRFQIEKLFDRGAEHGALVEKIRAAKASLARLGPRRAQTAIARLERAADKLSRIDFFPGEAKLQAAGALAELKRAYKQMYAGGEPRFSKRSLRPHEPARYRNRVWATRKSLWVDRLASAWLIKRFIDRNAQFLWIDAPRDCPKRAIGFDFDGARFTHAGNRVTYEVLLASFGLAQDPALSSIGAA